MKNLRKFFANNGLLLLFIALFVACLFGQAFSGLSLYNHAQDAHGLAQIGFWKYVTTGNFLQGMFSNWQAAILQLASLIIFSVFLRQRGAAHSRKPGESSESGSTRKRPLHPFRSMQSTKPSRPPEAAAHKHNIHKARTFNWLYCNSLSIAFVALFLVVFLLHLFSGVADYNQHRALAHQTALTALQFLASSKFWFVTLQTWEAEYMAIALYVFLSIFLRQEGSPESKRADATNAETGDTNK